MKAHWVPAEERLPTTSADYLVMCDGEITLAYYENKRWSPAGAIEVTYDESSIELAKPVTDWLEDLKLPKLPTK